VAGWGKKDKQKACGAKPVYPVYLVYLVALLTEIKKTGKAK
jgi:hypothetical protein